MKTHEAGFSYLDTMVGMTIMLIGLLGLAGTIAMSVIRSRQQEQQLLAKQYAVSTMESIISARDINAAGLIDGWDSIGNVGSNVVNNTPRGIFLNGNQPLRTGTGPDQVVGTADDSGATETGMYREIIITDVCDPERPSPGCSPAGTHPIAVRRVTVNIKYFLGRAQVSEAVSTTLTRY